MLITDVISSDFGMSILGFGLLVQGEKCINQCINIVCMTTKGTDPFRPDFGCDAIDQIDGPAEVVVPNIKLGIINSINDYVPRAELDSIVSNFTPDGKTNFNISYTIPNTVNTAQTNVTYGI